MSDKRKPDQKFGLTDKQKSQASSQATIPSHNQYAVVIDFMDQDRYFTLFAYFNSCPLP